MSSERHSV
jgi:hypothetical protein